MALTLPILTFDHGALSPTMGYVFRRNWVEPYESVVGILWKFARANALPGHLLAPELSPVPIDPYEGIDASIGALNVKHVAGLLGITQRQIREGIKSTRGLPNHSPILRYCRRCLRIGYHGVVHQFLGASQCPIHGDWLEELCPACNERTEYRLNAAVLDAPFRCSRCRRSLGQWSFERHRNLRTSERRAVIRNYLRS